MSPFKGGEQKRGACNAVLREGIRRAAKPPRPSDTPPMLGGAKPPRPSDTPLMLGGAKAALPLGASEAKRQPPYIPPNRREGRLYPS